MEPVAHPRRFADQRVALFRKERQHAGVFVAGDHGQLLPLAAHGLGDRLGVERIALPALARMAATQRRQPAIDLEDAFASSDQCLGEAVAVASRTFDPNQALATKADQPLPEAVPLGNRVAARPLADAAPAA